MMKRFTAEKDGSTTSDPGCLIWDIAGGVILE